MLFSSSVNGVNNDEKRGKNIYILIHHANKPSKLSNCSRDSLPDLNTHVAVRERKLPGTSAMSFSKLSFCLYIQEKITSENNTFCGTERINILRVIIQQCLLSLFKGKFYH